MANPLFEALNGNRMAGMLEQFQQFRKEMEGRNPNEEINRLLQSGKINQQQLNQAQQRRRTAGYEGPAPETLTRT